jgi:hypothetical protein
LALGFGKADVHVTLRIAGIYGRINATGVAVVAGDSRGDAGVPHPDRDSRNQAFPAMITTAGTRDQG